MSNDKPNADIRIYACGGAGSNVSSHFEGGASNEPGYANLHIAYIDTSRSNLSRPNINRENVFLLDGVDGSGKVRTENYAEINRNVRKILEQFKPMFLNIVVFSGSGGSGSVFSPLLISELLQRGEAVVAIMIGSDDSDISANNTLKTIKSLESIAQKTELPVVTYYRQNDNETKRSEIDADCHYVISALSLLCSKQNAELDSQDVINWVQYTRPTEAPPRFARLTIHDTRGVDQVESPISIASIMPNPDESSYNVVPDYHCVGYPELLKTGIEPRHLVISFDGITQIVGRLQKRIDELEVQKRARVSHRSLVNDGEADADGMVL